MKLSLLDHAKIVLAFALAFAVAMSFNRVARLPRSSLANVLSADGMIVSVVLATFAYAFVRSPRRRVALMDPLILGAALSCFAPVGWQGAMTIPRHLRGGGVRSLDGKDWEIILTTLATVALATYLGFRIGRRAVAFVRRRRSAG